MNYDKLKNLKKKPFFSAEDIAEIFDIKPSSAKVLCTRFVKKGIFTRLKKDFYTLSESLENPAFEDLLKLANFLQVPSYISFLSALSFHQVSTQVQINFIESACLKRTKKINIQGITFNFYKIKPDYYFGFEKINDIFVAIKEKALIDALYLQSFGKYKLDLAAVDFDKFDKKILKKMLKPFPKKTKKLVEELCGI